MAALPLGAMPCDRLLLMQIKVTAFWQRHFFCKQIAPALSRGAVKSLLLIILPIAASLLPASKAVAVCYCACVTATGGRCTVSVPDYSCHREGKSLCVDPLERCTYRCDINLERPASCNPRRRCSVREAG
jgi:hypothetical protein